MKASSVIAAMLISFVFIVPSAFSTNAVDRAGTGDEWKVFSERGDLAGYVKKEKRKIVFYNNDDVTFSEAGKDTWKIYDGKNTFLGYVKKDKQGFKFYDKNDTYLGLITESKTLVAKGTGKKTITNNGAHKKRLKITKISPEGIKLYLQVLNALDTIR